MVWEDFHSLKHLETFEMFAECPDIFFEVADTRHKHVSEPERLFIVFKPLGGLQCLSIAAACESFMSGVIELLDASGRLIREVNGNYVSIADLENGIYIVRYNENIVKLVKK